MREEVRGFRGILKTVQDGFFQHLGAVLAATVLLVTFLLAVRTIDVLRRMVDGLPSQWLLLALLLALGALGFAIHEAVRRGRLLAALQQHGDPDSKWRLVTHAGVWWKVYPESEYIEDFPYCPCCEPRRKLIQIEWHPDEKYRCPASNQEIQLYDGIPRGRTEILKLLYRSYFDDGMEFHSAIHDAVRRRASLEPDLTEEDVLRQMFDEPPLNTIPKDEREKILGNHENPWGALSFITEHFRYYRKYLKTGKREVTEVQEK